MKNNLAIANAERYIMQDKKVPSKFEYMAKGLAFAAPLSILSPWVATVHCLLGGIFGYILHLKNFGKIWYATLICFALSSLLITYSFLPNSPENIFIAKNWLLPQHLVPLLSIDAIVLSFFGVANLFLIFKKRTK